jgi:hypothetical protein
MRRLHHLVVSCVLLSGCFGPGEGVEVPQDQIYFPVGLALDAERQRLFVVNSDFDLQYNGGSIQSYRLGRFAETVGADPESEDQAEAGPGLRDVLPVRCVEDEDCRLDGNADGVCDFGLCAPAANTSPCAQGDRADAERLLYPGRCNSIDPAPLQQETVKIGAFATDAIIRSSASGLQRLFVPVRGDSTLHWLDVTGGKLQCGRGSDGACDAKHRVGDDASESPRNIELGAEPFAIDATANAENIVVTNQTTGTVALFTQDSPDWGEGEAPRLQAALRFPINSGRSRPVGVANLPLSDAESRAAEPAPFTFMLAFRDAAQVRLFRSAPESALTPEIPPYLVDGGGVVITANSVGSDSRGIAIDDSKRKAAEAACAGDEACLAEAALVPLDVYLANRSPSSLLIGRTQPPQQFPAFFQSLPLTTGPSRVVIGQVKAADGSLETRVFVVCFESRRIFVYDPQRSRIETEILTGRGPHAVAVDEKRALLYVGHFTDSYIGVFSLNLAFPDTYGTMLGSLGTPRSPRSSK